MITYYYTRIILYMYWFIEKITCGFFIIEIICYIIINVENLAKILLSKVSPNKYFQAFQDNKVTDSSKD